MNKDVKIALIVAGVAIAGYVAYNYWKKKNPTATAAPAPGNTNSSSGVTGGVAADINSAAGALGALGDSFGSIF